MAAGVRGPVPAGASQMGRGGSLAQLLCFVIYWNAGRASGHAQAIRIETHASNEQANDLLSPSLSTRTLILIHVLVPVPVLV